ncbi:MAG: putative MFS family arabinose efflux permease [Francisellaceae bacterium]|jgi:predicted MFS family arabinose efflux permease
MKIITTNIKVYAIVVLLLSASLLFYKYIIQVFPGLITNEIMSDFDINAASAGFLVGVIFYFIVIGQLLSGILLDRFGFRLISAFSLIISACGLIIFATTSDLFLAFLSRAMMGFGVSFATVSYLKAITVWFKPEQFAFASSFLVTAAMLGAIAGEAPIAILFEHIGWRNGLYICALIGFVLSLIYWLVVRDINPNNPKPSDRERASLSDFLYVIKKKENWLLTIYSGSAFVAVDAFAGLWGNNYLRELYGFSRTEAAGLISLIFFGMAIGGPIIGYISSKLDVRKTIMITCQSIAITALLISFYVPLPHIAIGCVLFIFGLTSVSFMLSFAVGKNINPIAVIATVAALINTGEPLLGGVFDWAVGYILDLNWSGQYDIVGAKYFSIQAYQIAFSILPAGMIIGLISLIFVKEKRYNN